MRGTSKVGSAGIAIGLLGLALLVLAPLASAKETHLPLGAFGSSAQPSFTAPVGLAVDQSNGDLYAVDRGRNEVQQVKVSATAGQFKLKFGGQTTANLSFNASNEAVQTALRNLSSIGGFNVRVEGGPGDPTGSHPYVIRFQGSLGSLDVEQLTCENGTTPLSGGSGCSVTTTAPGVISTIERFKPNGEPADFTALEGGATNVIDGQGAGDGTPQNGLFFGFGNANELQIAVDDSGTATDGDLYVTQAPKHAVDVFASSGEYLGQLTEFKEGPAAEGPLKPFSEACGVGVDSAGNLFVGDYEKGINKLKQPLVPHNPLENADNSANFALSEACTLAAGAGPTAGYLFADNFTGELFKLDAATGAKQYGGHPIATGATTVTVDPATGHLYAARGSEVLEYDASGATEAKLLSAVSTAGKVSGIAADKTSGDLYVAREGSPHLEAFGPLVTVPDVATEAPTAIAAAAATLHGTISAANGPAAHCSFQYLTEATYKAQKKTAEEEGKSPFEVSEAAFAGATGAACEPAGPFSGAGLNAVSAKAEPLNHETRYVFRLVGENEHTAHPADDPGEALSFSTFGKPVVKGAAATEITTDSAQIEGEVDPAGQETSFAVQYVTEADFQHSGYNKATSVPSPPEGIGNGAAFVPLSAQLAELQPETAYRFRLTATNADGAVSGPEGTFSTFAEPSGLLDNRAYELITPGAKIGEPFVPEAIARGGLGGSCSSCTPGWNTQRMPMQAAADGDAVGYEGSAFAGGLAAGANEYVSRRGPGGWQTSGLSGPAYRDGEPQGFKALSPDLAKGIYYQVKPTLSPAAPQGFPSLYLQEEGKAGLTPLLGEAPPHRSPGSEGANKLVLEYAGANPGTAASPAFTHVAFQANDALTEPEPGIAPKAPEVEPEETDLYEWSGGQLRLVNVLPGNATAAPDAVIGSGRLGAKGSETFDFDHAISADGSRIFWSKVPSGQLYVREAGVETIEVHDPGKFITATPSGSEVLLSDGCLYDLEEEECEDLTLDRGAVHKGGFQGIAGASEDLARVYFVDTEVLSGEEENANEEKAEAGAFNLYLWEAGSTVFIGRLLEGDNAAGSNGLGAWRPAPGSRLAQATADGGFLAFESRAPLTGYDNTVRGAAGCVGGSGSPQCFEVFEYDAATHTLACPSCNPSGERPLGPSNLSLIFNTTVLEFFPQPRNLPPQGQGRLFFESQDALTQADQNGHIQDVYEWEPAGVGSCARAGGCLALISGGRSPNDSQFLDASANGSDAFFTTRETLVPADQGGDFMDLYDARSPHTPGEALGFPEAPVVHCEGEACRGSSTAAGPEQSPGSAGFRVAEPPPAPRPCRKGFVKKRGACVKQHKAQKRSHSRAHRNRGGRR